MPSKELIDAIRTGTQEQIGDALDDAGAERAWGGDAQLLAEAIVAARDKPEDVVYRWCCWPDENYGPLPQTIADTYEESVSLAIKVMPGLPIHRVTITREP